MGWKLRKEKLRADAEPEAAAAPDTPEMNTANVVPSTSPEANASTDVVSEAFAPSFEAAVDTPAPEPLVLDKPHSETGDEETDNATDDAFAPLSFDGAPSFDDSPALDDGPSFDALDTETATDPGVTLSDTDTPPRIHNQTFSHDDAFLPETPTDTLSAFAPYVAPEPDAIALGAETYEPTVAMEPEVGATAFAPLDASPAPLETNAEAAETPVFEPAFEDGNAQTMPEPNADHEPFMNRDALAAGLVTTESETGLPKVAPFVLDAADSENYAFYETGPHTLVVRLGSLSATYPISKPVMTIGRPDSDSQNYPDIEIELDDGVSRKHAEIRHEGDEYLLVDLGSTNGTSLNGELLTTNQPVPLMHGDHIRIGERTEIVFE